MDDLEEDNMGRTNRKGESRGETKSIYVEERIPKELPILEMQDIVRDISDARVNFFERNPHFLEGNRTEELKEKKRKKKEEKKKSIYRDSSEESDDYNIHLNAIWDEIDWDLRDDGTHCDICGNYETSEDDEILFCDGCDVAVHQTCHGVDKVPEGDWFCLYCQQSRSVEGALLRLKKKAMQHVNHNKDNRSHQEIVKHMLESYGPQKLCILPKRCPICPRMYGAYALNDNGIWMHLCCALWQPRCWIVDNIYPGGVDLIEEWQWRGLCEICRVRQGAVIRCSEKDCPSHFHPTCGVMAGYGMNITDQILTEKNNDSDVSFRAFCIRHRRKVYKTTNADIPLEVRKEHPDFASAFLQCTNIIRRNRSILEYLKQCLNEESVWGKRMATYLMRDFEENVHTLRILWNSIKTERRIHGGA